MALENILSQEIIQKLGWTLLHFVWQAAAGALLVGILLALLRKSSANLRYIIACAALGLIVLLPMVTMQLVPVSTPQPIASIEPPPAPVIVSVQPTTEEIPLAGVVEYEEPEQLESTDVMPKIPWKHRAADLLEPILPYLVSGWLIGVFGLSLWHLGGWAQLQRLRKKLVRQVDESLCATLNRLSERLQVKRAVQLLESALVQVPTVVGWLRPVILLPASALTGLSSEQLEALLAHELAHIRRYDYLVNMLQTVVETLGFYHPAVWWVSHKIRIERENCCDDLAVSISGDRIRYARALTCMEEIRGRHGELAVAATGGNLFGRIRRLIAADSSENSHLSWVPSAIAIMLIVALALPTTLALSRRSSDESHEIESSLLEKLADPKVNAEGQQILKQMAEVNRYWLIAPSPKVKNYSYDFNLYDWGNNEPIKEIIKVKRPTKVNSKRRQGITYDSVLHRLISNPSATIIRKIRKDRQLIQLDFIFRDFTEIECGNGISHSWRGYFSGQVKTGSLWLDAEKIVPVKVKAGWLVEYYSEYVTTDKSHYVPLKVIVGNESSRYHWLFGLYEPGLWLFENATYRQDEESQPRMAASINNLKINQQAAVKTKTVAVEVSELKDNGEIKDNKASNQNKSVTLTLTEQGMLFEGHTVTWDQFGSLLADVPEPENTGLKLVVASDSLSSEKLNDVKTRISILSRELGLKYLSCISNDAPTPEKSCEEHFFTAPLEFNKDIYIRQNATGQFKQKYYRNEKGWGTDETGQHKELATVYANSIKFQKSLFRGNVSAKLKIAYASWPKAKWQIVVRLLDNGGNSLAQASHNLDTGGYILSGKVLYMSSKLDFSFGRDEKLSKAAAFEIAVTPLPENESSSEPTAEFLLDKMLEHRSRVRNLQYVAENNIWRDPATEKVRIENQIKSMRESGIPERQLERLRQSRSNVPESRYQILKCTVDDEEHVKIEQTGGTYDSSGKKVPREEKHVWAWNGVLATQFDQLSEIPGNAIVRDKPQVVTKLGHPWRGFTGIFCGFLQETIEADKQVSVDELKDGTYRIAFDYKTSGIVAIVDPSKGYTCALRENHFNEQLSSRHTATYEEVTEGIWFLVSGQIEHYTANGSLYSKSTIKSSHIRINDPAFNVSYFDVDMPKGATVRDEVHGKQYVVGSKLVHDLDEPQKSSVEEELVDPNSWQKKFYSTYSLEDGQVLKRIAPPFIPERRGYFKSVQPGRYSQNTYHQLVSQYFNWDGKLSIRGARVGSGIPRLKSTLESVIGLVNRQYDIPPEILGADMSGDWIVRKDTPQEELLQTLEQIVKDETSRDIDFVKQKVETDVIIAKGKYNFQLLPNITDGQYVLISTNNTDTYTGGGGGSGTLDKFLRWVGNRVGMNIVDVTEAEGVELSWRNHDSSELSRLSHNAEPYNQRLDLLLENLTRQTGLTFERKTATVEKWFISENGIIKVTQKVGITASDVESGARANIFDPSGPVVAKSATPSGVDKSIVRIDLSMVEVSPDSKMDRETTIKIKNLLGGKITIPDSPAIADLLRTAAEATAAVKDETAGDKRVTQKQFKALLDLLVSRSYVKILMNPTLEVVDGGTAQIRSEQKIPSMQDSLVNLIQITPNVLENDYIILQVEATHHQRSISQNNKQTPIINKFEISTQIRLSPGESGIIGGMGTKQAGLLTEPDKAAKELEVPASELLVILTPTIVDTAGNQQNEEMVLRIYDISDLVHVGARISRGTVDGMMDGSGVMTRGQANIPNQAIVNEAQKIVNLIMQTIDLNSWYENNPNAIGTISPYPPTRPRKLAIYQTLPAHQQIEKILESRREQTDTTQISIRLRYLYTNVEFIDEVRDSMDIEFTSDTFLDDKQLETLLRASLKKRDIRSLMAPGVTVLNNETAQFNTARHIFMSFLGYSEPNNISQQSTPVPVDTFCTITPHIEDNKNIIIDFVQDIPGLQERIIYDRREMVQSYTETTSITNKRIPNNKTFAFICDIKKFDQDNQTASPAEKKTLIVLIKPIIIVPEEMPRSEAAAMILNSQHLKDYTAEQSDETILLKPLPEEQPDTGKTQIMIDTKILTVSDEFLKYIGLDPNSAASSEDWSDYLVHSTDDSASFVINQLHADLILKAAAAHENIGVLTAPQVLALSGKKFEIHTIKPDSYMLRSPPGEPNAFYGEPESKSKRIELGTTVRLTPTLTPDGKNVELDFEWEYRRLRGIKEYTGPDGKVQKIPQVDVDRIKTPCTIPDGKTLLITGKKIIEQKTEPKKPRLSDLPLIGGLFSSPTKTEETKYLLIMVKPVINPPKKAPPKPQPIDPNDPLMQPIDPNDPLVIKLEEKFKRSDEKSGVSQPEPSSILTGRDLSAEPV